MGSRYPKRNSPNATWRLLSGRHLGRVSASAREGRGYLPLSELRKARERIAELEAQLSALSEADVSSRAANRARDVLRAQLRLVGFAETHSLAETLQAALDEAGALTESPIGFLHFMEADERTLWLQAWSTRTIETFCTAEGAGSHYDVGKAGVWVDCVHQRRPVIHNDYASLPHRKGMPAGHAEVIRELVVPLIRNDKIVAILGVGNKPEDYTDEDVKLVSRFAEIAWEIAEKKRAQDALQEKQNLLSEAQRIAHVGHWWHDLVTGEIHWSDECFRILGREPQKVTAETGLSWIHPDDVPVLQRATEESAAGEKAGDHEFRVLRPDGEIRWIHNRWVGVYDDDGREIKRVGTHQDITERRQAEDRERLARHLLNLLNKGGSVRDLIGEVLALIKSETGFSAIGIRLKDGNDFPYFATEGFSEQFVLVERNLCIPDDAGDVLRDAKGNPVLDCMCGVVLSAQTDPSQPFFTPYGSFWTSSTTDLLAKTSEEDRRARTRNRCNGEGYESVALIPLRTGDETIGLLQMNDFRRGMFTRETVEFFESLSVSIGIAIQRGRAQDELRESEERFRSLSENIAIGAAMISPDMEILSLNRQMREWFPTIDPSQRPTCYRAYNDPPRGAPCSYCPTVKTLRDGQTHQATTSTPTPDGIRRYRVVSSPVLDSNGAVCAAIEMVEDVTESARVAAELQRSTAMLRAIIEAAPTAIISLDLEGCVTNVWNPAAERMLGWSAEEVMGQVLPSVPAESREEFYRFRDQICEGLMLSGVDVRRRRKDGKPVDYSIFASPLRDADDQITGNVAVLVDITERKKAEEDLVSREREYRTLVENLPDFVVRYDADLRRTFVNPAWEKASGLSASEVIGVLPTDVPKVREPVVDEYQQTLRHVLETGVSETVEFSWVNAKDENLVLDYVVIPEYDGQGNISGVLAIGRDVTVPKQAEQEIRKLSSAVEQSPATIVITDTSGAIEYVNPTFTQTTGYSRDEAIGENPRILKSGETLPEEYQRLWETISSGRVWRGEFHNKKKNGELYWESAAIAPVLDSNGDIERYVAIKEDITARKVAEDTLRRVNRELRAITHVNQTLLRAADEQSLLDDVCRIVVEDAGYRLAWVGYSENDEAKSVRPVAWAGFESDYVKDARLSWSEETERGRGLAGLAIRTGETIHAQDFATHTDMEPWREAALKRGYRSGIALPLKDEKENVFGVLLIYSATPYTVTPDEIRLMEGLAQDTAFGIQMLRIRAEHKRAVDALRESEERYRLIAENTADTIAVFDMDLNPTYVSPSIYKLRGFTAEEAVAQTIDQIVTPETLEDVRRIIAEEMALEASGAADPSRSVVMETEQYYKDGSTIWVESTASFLRDDDRRPVAFLTVTRDISDRKRIEEETLRSNQRLRFHREQSPLGFLEWDEDFRAVEWNAACERIFGYTREEAIGKYAKDLILPEAVRDLVDGIYKQLMSQSGGQHSINENVTKDGRIIICEWFNTTLVDANGRAIGIASICSDITEQRRAEEALRRSNERTSILNRIADIFLTISDDTMYAKVLDIVREVMRSPYGLFGFLREPDGLVLPSLTREVWDQCAIADKSIVFPPESWGDSLWGRAIRERKTYRSSGPFHTPEGHVPIDQFMAAPILFGGETIGVISVANKDDGYTGKDEDLLNDIAIFVAPILNARLQRDVQEQRRYAAEKALRESEQKYRLLVDNANEGILIVQDRLVAFPNRKALDILGRSDDELNGASFVGLVHPEDRESVEEYYFNNAAQVEVPEGYRFRILDPSGKDLWAQLAVAEIAWEDRPATLCLLRDITREVSLENQFRQAQKMEAIGRFAGGVAHDFNNLLVVISGNAGLAANELRPDDPVRESIVEIQEAGDRAAALTRQILAFSRAQVLNPKALNLNTLLAGLKKMLPRLIGEDVDLRTALASDLWTIKADAGQIEQVIMNLATNARDAMPKGGILTVETANVDLDDRYAASHVGASPGPHVMLAVTDNGHGMDLETLSRVFEPFFTTKEKGKGTGLGLASVYGIVRQNGGSIWVYSEPGKGTTIKLYFPRVDEAPGERSLERKAAEPGTGETVLVVEDDVALRRFLIRVLNQSNYGVIEAREGEEALRLAKELSGQIDLLLTDVVMPRMGGADLASQLKKVRPEMKVLFISGYTDRSVVFNGLLKHEDQFLQKPFDAEVLLSRIRQVLRKK